MKKHHISGNFKLLITLILLVSSNLIAAEELLERDDKAIVEENHEYHNLPEVIEVTSQMSVINLRSLVVEKEARMFNLFNELNDDDYYDVRCSWQAPMNSKLKEWSCLPEFMIEAKTEEAEFTLMKAQGLSSGIARPVFGVAVKEYPVLKEKMKEIMTEYPEVFDALTQLNQSREELNRRKNQ